MSKSKGTKKISKKETRQIVFKKLSGALAEYKDVLKEKRLTSNLKKISKLFAVDIAKASAKQSGELKKRKKKVIRSKKEEANEPQPIS